MLILIVEDDARVADFLRRGLKEEGYEVDVCQRGDQAHDQGLAQPYDLILLDWGLPGTDGLTVLRQWRQAGMVAPVLMLTARGGIDPTVLALDAGADDYIEKPFSFEELLARIRAHFRRAQTQGIASVNVTIGQATIDLRRRTILRDGTTQELSSREFELLDFLLKHRGETVSRTRILDRVWGLSHDPTTNVVDVYIRYLRAKLDPPDTDASPNSPQTSVIETVRGRGYRLRPDDELLP